MIFQKIFLKLLCCLNYIYNYANRKTQVILQGNEVWLIETSRLLVVHPLEYPSLFHLWQICSFLRSVK